MSNPYYPKPHPPYPAPGNSSTSNLINGHLDPELAYHKGIEHDHNGAVVPEKYDLLLKALNEHTPEAFRAIQLPEGGRKLVNPQSGLAADRETADGWLFRLPKPPEQDGHLKTTFAEYIELAWMHKLKGLNFNEWTKDHSDIKKAINEIKDLPLYTQSDCQNDPIYTSRTPNVQSLFRGGDWDPESNHEHIGPMISQFLWLNVPYGMQSFDQRERRRVDTDFVPSAATEKPRVGDNEAHLTNFEDWLNVQNGKDTNGSVKDLCDDEATYIHNMGGLARYVHLDKLYQAYLNAAFILIGAKVPYTDGNPYGPDCNELGSGTCAHPSTTSKFPSEEGFGTFSVPHILSLVTEAATRALKAVWYQKWVANLRFRPEAFGGLIHRGVIRNEENPQSLISSIEADIQKSRDGGVLNEMPSLLLPMSFSEGSPTHPAYGAGHATVAGACVTLLKAFFNEKIVLSDHLTDGKHKLTPMEPDPTDGFKSLTNLQGDDASLLTIGSELDKLASNISLGRNMAGVHWRSDHTQSLLLGQRIAVSILYTQRVDYHERPWNLSFRSFSGKTVEIVYEPDGREGVYMNDEEILGAVDLPSTEEAKKLLEII